MNAVKILHEQKQDTRQVVSGQEVGVCRHDYCVLWDKGVGTEGEQ